MGQPRFEPLTFCLEPYDLNVTRLLSGDAFEPIILINQEQHNCKAALFPRRQCVDTS